MKRKTVQITNWIWQIKSAQNGIKVFFARFEWHSLARNFFLFVFIVIRFYSLLLFHCYNCSSSRCIPFENSESCSFQTNTVNIILTSNLSDVPRFFSLCFCLNFFFSKFTFAPSFEIFLPHIMCFVSFFVCLLILVDCRAYHTKINMQTLLIPCHHL